MTTGMRKWMEKGCPDIPTTPAEVSIDREELRQLRDELVQYKNERDELRTKVAEMEQQEPVMWANSSTINSSRINKERGGRGDQHTCSETQTAYHDTQLYALPGAQLAPNAIAYLDLGAGGYMDIGTDLTDEALAAIPKGRHMLGIIGTYGVDGYLPAQPAPSVSDGWKEAAIAWEVCGSLHREYAKGKDPFFKKRQEDFVKHANDARTMLAAAQEAKS